MKLQKLTLKQGILLLLTLLSLIPVVLALIGSVTQPQVQANLQLYQTNLILQATEFPIEMLDGKLDIDRTNLETTRKALLGNDPYAAAETQYQEAIKLAQKNIELLRENSSKNIVTKPKKSLDKKEEKEKFLYEAKNIVKELDLKLGIIKVTRGETEEALQIWDDLLKPSPKKQLVTKPKIIKTATLLKGLWSDPPEVLPEAESQIQRTLNGWFRDRVLKRLYEIQNRQEDLTILKQQQLEVASQSLLKIAFVSVIPLLGGVLGVGILLFLSSQFFFNRQESLLFIDRNLAWETPWSLETVWQVLIVGFLFVGQILLPILFSVTWIVLSINPSEFSLRFKAIYVLISYLTLAVGGLIVLFVSLKPFFPLPKDWLQFKWLSNWILWGLGGYFVALPLVIIVSLVNQAIWQGQGGSNPLLFLALEAQDRVALAIFFITASIAAPVFEEILFRGFLLPSLTRYLPVWGAIVVSSLIFAVAHLSLSEVLPLATLGIVLGFVYTRSRNLLSSILLHSLWNSGTLISLFVLGSSTST